MSILFLIGSDFASMRWTAIAASDGHAVGLYRGALLLVSDRTFTRGFGCVVERDIGPRFWWIRWEKQRSETVIAIPLWVLWLSIGSMTAWLWWLDTRDKGPGFCKKCHYDLRGLQPASGEAAGVIVCPECGLAARADEVSALAPTRDAAP